MAFNLAAAKRKLGNRRRRIVFRPIRVRPAQVAALNALYQQVVNVWAEHVDELLTVYRRSVSPVMQDSAEELTGLMSVVAQRSAQAVVRVIGQLRGGWGERVERWHRQTFAEGIFSATGVRVDTILMEHDAAETVGAVIARNTELIRNVDAEVRGRIGDIVFRGTTARTPIRQVAKEIAEATEMSRRRSLNIASHQTVALAASLDEARQAEVGIDHFTWRHSGKKHPRPDHVARNGVLYKWRAGTAGPGRDPPADKPGQLPFCGCVAQATLLDEGGEAL